MSQQRIYQNIFNIIQNDIINKTYPIGSKLPAERDLAVQFAVSRTSVREAIIALEVCGLVEVKLGSGVYVIKSEASSRTSSNDTLMIHPQLQPYLKDQLIITPFDVLEARLHIEPYLAELAAQHRTAEQLREIKHAFFMNIEDNLENSEAHIGDRLFHIRIAEASQNSSYVHFLKFLLGQHYTELFSRMRSLYTPEDMPLRSQHEHQDILIAIQLQDAVAARAAMTKHIQHVIQIFSRSVEEQAN